MLRERGVSQLPSYCGHAQQCCQTLMFHLQTSYAYLHSTTIHSSIPFEIGFTLVCVICHRYCAKLGRVNNQLCIVTYEEARRVKQWLMS